MGNEDSQPIKEQESAEFVDAESTGNPLLLWDPAVGHHEQLRSDEVGTFQRSAREDMCDDVPPRFNTCSGIFGSRAHQDLISQGASPDYAGGDATSRQLRSKPKFVAACREYFDRFDRNRDERLSLEELRVLVEAVCTVWQVPAPDAGELLVFFERHRPIRASGLSREAFASFADELLEHMLDRYPNLSMPSAATALAARGLAASRSLLHAPLPTSSSSLHSMGATGVSVVLSEVRGLPGGGSNGILAGEEQLCCLVVVRRKGRLLPRRSSRATALVSRGPPGAAAEPRWRFDEELVFDDPTLLGRRGDLHCCIVIRRRPGSLSRALLVVEGVQVPTAGEISVQLVDGTGQQQGEVQLRVGWQCSESLVHCVAGDVQHAVQHGQWAQARLALEINGAEATELVAESVDLRGRTLLMWAARHEGGTAFVRDLLALGEVGRFAVDAQDATAVHYAALSGSLESLAALLGSRVPADDPAPGLGGITPIMLAALRGSPDYVRLLLGFGAVTDRADNQGLSPVAWVFGSRWSLLVGGCELWAQEVGWPAEQFARETAESDSEEWGPDRLEVLSLLVEDLWNRAPPFATADPRSIKPLPALCKFWFRVAERAAERAPPPFFMLFAGFLHSRCTNNTIYQRLLKHLFEEALTQRCERLAFRLVSELGALDLNAGSVSSSSSPEVDSGDLESSTDLVSIPTVLEAAVEAGMPQLASVLLMSSRNGDDNRPCLGPPSSAVRTLRLATERGNTELVRAVLRQMPRELPRDLWQEPAVLGGSSLCECPVCFRPLYEQAVALYCTASGRTTAVACPHLVCFGCSERLGGKCPLCRAWFTEVHPLPDPSEDPIAWFRFAANSVVKDGGGVSSSSLQERGCTSTGASSSATGRHLAETADGEVECALGGQSKVALTRSDVERVLPATLPVDPHILHQALDAGVWQEWDADGDSRISQEDFFDPDRGLLRWLLRHIHELRLVAKAGEAPDLEDNRQAWFHHTIGLQASLLKDGRRRPVVKGTAAGLTRGETLCALLRLTGTSSLDRPQVDHFRSWVEEHWCGWDPSGSGRVEYQTFVQPGGLADGLLEMAALTRVKCSVKRLAINAAEAGKQVEELAQLCRCVAGNAVATGNSSSSGGSSTSSSSGSRSFSMGNLRFTAVGVAARCARRAAATSKSEADAVLYGEALPLVLAALERHPRHTQVVGNACRALVVLLLAASESVASMSPDEVTWPRLLQAVLSGDGAAAHLDMRVAAAIASSEATGAFDQLTASASSESVAAAAGLRVIKAVATLCASPGAAADMRALCSTVVAAAAVLRLFFTASPPATDGSEGRHIAALALQNILAEVPLEGHATPATRAFACLVASGMLCDVGFIAGRLEAWGHDFCPLWSPPRALAPARVRVGQPVEVCCHGGWLGGEITRAPAAEPSSPRDECWVVTCGNDTRVYSRHVWAPGWRDEAAAALERLRLILLASVTVPRTRLPGARAMRTMLLNSVIVDGLAPRAMEPSLEPGGPVLKGAGGIPVRVGDKVWLMQSVERARQMQTQRHGDWSEPMAFCLDCPGRVVETLTGPPRVRVSHGGLGAFSWNPLIVIAAEACPEPLPFEEQHGPIVIGDEVLLCAIQELTVPLQVGHGGWSTRMAFCLGRYARIAALNSRGDVRIDTPGCGAFLWNPAAIEPIDGGSPVLLCAHAVARLDDEGAAVLLLSALRELSSVDEVCDAAGDPIASAEGSEACGLQDVLDTLLRAGVAADRLGLMDWLVDSPTVPRGLRAYGALALLACALDLKGICDLEPSEKAPKLAPPTPEVCLPDAVSASVLTALKRSEAMHWSAADTGGVAFAEVVAGRVDVVTAVSRWVLAFFASRHRRLLTPGRSFALEGQSPGSGGPIGASGRARSHAVVFSKSGPLHP